MQNLTQTKNFLLSMPMEIDARRLRFLSGSFSFFEFLPMSNLSALGEVFWLLILYSGVKVFLVMGFHKFKQT
jgi:hypothetical protein